MKKNQSGSEPSRVTEKKYFAHSVQGKDVSHWQPLSDHLQAVGAHAARRAALFGAASLAQVQGQLHDLGKYTQEFQERIRGNALRVDHSTWGARIACERYGHLGRLISYGIAGHHAGLANGAQGGERSSLQARLEATLPALDTCWQQEIQLPAGLASPEGFKPRKETAQFQLAFLARMLFSCLVDADFLDTEAFYQQAEGVPSSRATERPSLVDLREQLNERLQKFAADTPVNQLRAEILRHVRGEALREPGLFSLTVPTGGGKTLASLAFALDHAIRHGLRRVIFVIPFTSIVEQNAAVFRQAFGALGDDAVLEHHSAYAEDLSKDLEARDKVRLAMENWDAPVVVTTAVQFFESLFAARPSPCRKLHNMAGSVVILDEAQTLPLKVLRPCMAAIDELARNYRSSVVLCTATQPALNAPDFAGGLEEVRELAPQPEKLFKQLRRVKVRHVGTLSDEALAEQLRARRQVLCIVNNRRHAQAVYQAIADQPGTRHLSTLMCARHRSAVLAEVRERLLAEEPCRLVSTSLIEAGVDVDFPAVFRAEAGLDSVAQAAGRCNREGRWDWRDSEVLVFANEQWAPPPELKQFAQAGREVFRSHAEDLLSPAAIEAYFRLLYWQKGDQALDAQNLLDLVGRSRLDSLPLETLAAKFRMIESTQMAVIIPWDEAARREVAALQHAPFASGIARRLQPYLVQLQQGPFNALRSVGAVQAVAPERWEEQFMVLANMSLYDEHHGLTWDQPSYVSADSLTW